MSVLLRDPLIDFPKWPKGSCAGILTTRRFGVSKTIFAVLPDDAPSPSHADKFCMRTRPQRVTEFGNYEDFNRSADGAFSLLRSMPLGLRREKKFEDVSAQGSYTKSAYTEVSQAYI